MASITSLSAIVVTGLTAKSGIVSAVPLSWSYTTPPGQGCLSYMLPASFEIYRGTTNSFAAATTVLIGTSPVAAYTDTSPLTGAAFYFIVALDPNGYRGVPTAGVSATAAPAAATTTALNAAIADYTAQIVEEASNRQGADGALASSLTVVSATATDAQSKANLGTASGQIGFQAVAAPSGFTAAFQLMAKVVSGVLRVAGVAADVTATLARLRLIGDSIVIQDSSGNIFPLFSNGKIAVGRLSAGIIDAVQLFVNGVQVVATGSIFSNAITVFDPKTVADRVVTAPGSLGDIISDSITVGQGESVEVLFTCTQTRPGSDSANYGVYNFAIYCDNALMEGGTAQYFYDDNFMVSPIMQTDNKPGAGSHTYRIQCSVTSYGGAASFTFQNIRMNLKRFQR